MGRNRCVGEFGSRGLPASQSSLIAFSASADPVCAEVATVEGSCIPERCLVASQVDECHGAYCASVMVVDGMWLGGHDSNIHSNRIGSPGALAMSTKPALSPQMLAHASCEARTASLDQGIL